MPTRPKRHAAWRTLRNKVIARDKAAGAPCCRCGHPIDYTLKGNTKYGPTVDHLIPIAATGEVLVSMDLLATAHLICNSRHGAAIGHAKRGTGPGSRGGDPDQYRKGAPKRTKPTGERPSMAGLHNSHLPSPAVCTDTFRENVNLGTLSEAPRAPGEWDGMPRAFPGPHPDAAGSLGDAAVSWIEQRMASDARSRGRSLRWWQWLVLQRLLEVDAGGQWCWPTGFVSVARQQGKSVLLGELAAWRAAHAEELFGGRQEIGHSASTVVLSRLLQSQWWPWAADQGHQIAKQLGDSQIVWPDGSTWRTIHAQNMYGRSLDLVLADEVWSWSAEDYWEATFPTLVERPRSQAVLLSAAHDQPKSLVWTLRGNPDVAVMEWGARPGDQQEDPEVWRRSSAVWTPQREQAMRMGLGQSSFASQWLNVWPDPPDTNGANTWGRGLAAHLGPAGHQPWQGPLHAAVESDPGGKTWGAAVSDGSHVVAVAVPSLAGAVQWLTGNADGARGLLVHETVAQQLPPDLPLKVTSMPMASVRAATALFRDLIRDGGLTHAGDLAAQLPNAEVTGGGGHEYIAPMRSRGPVAVVKAASWAVWRAAVPESREPLLF